MSNKRLQFVLIASTLTAAITVIFRYFSFPSTTLGGTLSFILGLSALLTTNLIAATPGYALLKIRKAPSALSISIFGVIESFWLVYWLAPVGMYLGGWNGWAALTVILIMISYIAGDLIFNARTMSRSRALGLAAAVIFVTMLLSLFAPKF